MFNAAHPHLPAHRGAPGTGNATRRGFTLIGVLIIAAVLAIIAATAVSAGVAMQRRAAEQDLLAIGLEFRNAFKSYYEAAISTPRYPVKLDDLLRDPRFPGIRRHLRKLYADPLTGRAEWGTIEAPGGGIMGVYSLATGTPIKTALFVPEFADFEGKAKYADWQFAYVAPELGNRNGQTGTTGSASSTVAPTSINGSINSATTGSTGASSGGTATSPFTPVTSK